MNTPHNSVSPVAGGSRQPPGRSHPSGGGPHPAAGPGARFPCRRPFRCEGRGRRARTVAAAAGCESGGGGGAEQGPPSPPSPPSLPPSLPLFFLPSLPPFLPFILPPSLPPSLPPFLHSSLPSFRLSSLPPSRPPPLLPLFSLPPSLLHSSHYCRPRFGTFTSFSIQTHAGAPFTPGPPYRGSYRHS